MGYLTTVCWVSLKNLRKLDKWKIKKEDGSFRCCIITYILLIFFKDIYWCMCVCCIFYFFVYPLFHVLNFGQIYCFKCALWIKIWLRMYWEPKINYLTDSYLYSAVEALSWFMASFHLVVWRSWLKLMELQIQKSMIIFVSTIWKALDWQKLQFLIWQWSQIRWQ